MIASKGNEMAISRKVLTDRTAWGKEARAWMNGRCMGCGRKKADMHIHEIERRGHAPDRWAHRCNYLLLCPLCHGWRFDAMPHAEQLAYKMFWDEDNYDLYAWLRLRDPELKAMHRVTFGEVAGYFFQVKEMFDGR